MWLFLKPLLYTARLCASDVVKILTGEETGEEAFYHIPPNGRMITLHLVPDLLSASQGLYVTPEAMRIRVYASPHLSPAFSGRILLLEQPVSLMLSVNVRYPWSGFVLRAYLYDTHRDEDITHLGSWSYSRQQPLFDVIEKTGMDFLGDLDIYGVLMFGR